MVFPSQSSNSTDNRILAALDQTEYRELFSQLEPVSLTQGQLIYDAGTTISYVYFPLTAVFSMLATMEDGNTVEVGPVGREGLAGLRIFLGAETSVDRVIVHVAGDAMRLRASVLKGQLNGRQDVLSQKLMRYTQMLLTMTARSSACNRLHTVEQQLARWLLTMSDYVGGQLRLTHELMALTLGVRRAGVTTAANNFRNFRVIDYRRSVIQIVNREGLQAVACECYQIIKEEYDDLYAELAK